MSARDDLSLILVVPGLFGPSPPPGVDPAAARAVLAEPLALDAIEQWLSRAAFRPAPDPEISTEGLVLGHCGVTRDASGDWPVAALTRLADGDSADTDAWHLRADPVHLVADSADLRLAPGAVDDLDAEEAAALCAELNVHLDGALPRFEPLAPTRWYLRFEDPPAVRTVEPSRLAGAPLRTCLPAGEDAARMAGLLNEIQMLLHASPVNAAREARGASPANGVWLWGGGRAPVVAAQTRAGPHLWWDAALARGLGTLGAARCGPAPGDATDWLAAASPGPHLLVLDGAERAARSSDVEAWQGFMERFERAWAAPLLDALGAGRIARLALDAGGHGRFDLRPSDRWRLWRRRRGLGAHAGRTR